MEKLEDSYLHRGKRKQLVREVSEKGIKDPKVIAAISKVPRHYFFDDIFLQHAYEDKAFPIGEGQTISQPYTVAFQTELLRINPGDKILEIGTGSGYQACILLEVGAIVHTIEYNKKLYQKTATFLPKIGYRPHFYRGDGSRGLPEHGPYHGIIVTAGAPTVPNPLIAQLKVGGSLVIPVGNARKQKMLKLTKVSTNKIVKKEYNHFSFVPLLGENGWNE
ncbi:MAG: protein-L-isoaspartate(D-aspartate) O-methyltransferase [Cyclobacteriaceae bacterium]|nr:protein-L-isoaspartate(D-aspartate) O-methyltransferase [Cyclobacteriaceae bacterium HetDA_MAG_MS6]